MGNEGLVDVVEAAYTLGESNQGWLAGLSRAARSTLSSDGPALAVLFDLRKSALEPEVMGGAAEGLPLETLAGVIASADFDKDAKTLIDRVAAAGSIASIRDCYGEGFEQTAFYRDFFKPNGLEDAVFVNAKDASGFVCTLTAGLRRRASELETSMMALHRLEAHLATAYRLRRALEEAPATGADAVLDAAGHVLHAEGEATHAVKRTALRASALAVERARGPLRRRDPEEALGLWRAMVAGEWTLVDRFESDGKRFIVAHRNAPAAPETGPLTPHEHRVATLAALGYTNKLIGYALGLAPSTVTERLQRACAKLGASSRAEMIRALGVIGGPIRAA